MADNVVHLTMRLRSKWMLWAAYFVRRPRWLHDRIIRRAIEVSHEP